MAITTFPTLNRGIVKAIEELQGGTSSENVSVEEYADGGVLAGTLQATIEALADRIKDLEDAPE